MDSSDRLLLSRVMAPVSFAHVQTAKLDAHVIGRRSHLADLPDVLDLGYFRLQDRLLADDKRSRVAHHLGPKVITLEGKAIEA